MYLKVSITDIFTWSRANSRCFLDHCMSPIPIMWLCFYVLLTILIYVLPARTKAGRQVQESGQAVRKPYTEQNRLRTEQQNSRTAGNRKFPQHNQIVYIHAVSPVNGLCVKICSPFHNVLGVVKLTRCQDLSWPDFPDGSSPHFRIISIAALFLFTTRSVIVTYTCPLMFLQCRLHKYHLK